MSKSFLDMARGVKYMVSMRVKYVPDAIRRYRERRGLSQRELAERVGVSRLTITTGERGIYGLRAVTLARIVTVLAMPITALFQRRRGR